MDGVRTQKQKCNVWIASHLIVRIAAKPLITDLHFVVIRYVYIYMFICLFSMYHHGNKYGFLMEGSANQ